MVQLTSFIAFLAAASVATAGHSFQRVRRHHHVPLQLRAEKDAAASTKESNSNSNTTSAASSSGGFVHPGVFVSQGQLDFVKEQVDAKKEPWASAFDQMMDSEYLKLSREPSPRGSVDCGSRSQNPSNGCTNEREDAMAAYGMALAFGITGDEKYAKKSADYMDSWAQSIKKHTASNAPLQTGWSAASWARAAELLKHTYPAWNSASTETMLREVYLPNLVKGDDRTGNWDLVMLESAIGISVFLDDRESYNAAMDKFKGRVPAYIYMKGDGKSPKAAPGSPQSKKRASGLSGFWHNQQNFAADGIAQETCRDFVHTGYGLASISHVYETALIQGENLYETELGDRLRAGLEFHSEYQLGADQPDFLCPGNKLVRNLEAVTEPGFNAFSTQMGASMPNTKKLTEKFRKENAFGNRLFVAYETLTHAGNPAAFSGSSGNSTATPITTPADSEGSEEDSSAPDPAEDNDESSPAAPTQDEPEQTGGNNTGDSGNSSGGQNFQGGRVTFYDQGGNKGACGEAHGDYDLIAAMNTKQFYELDICGKKVEITSADNKKVTVTVVDMCPGCETNSIDLSRGAFQQLGSFDRGIIPIKSWKLL